MRLYAGHARREPIVDFQCPENEYADLAPVPDAIANDLFRIKKRDRAQGAPDDGRRDAANKVAFRMAVA
jgi:hypothetical protein